MNALQHFDTQALPDTGPLLVALRHPVRHLDFPERFKYYARDCSFEIRLCSYTWRIFAGLQNVGLLAIPTSNSLHHDSRLVARIRGVSSTLNPNASSLCILFRLYARASLRSGLCLPHFDVGAHRMNIYCAR